MRTTITSKRLDATVRTLREVAQTRKVLRRVHSSVRRYIGVWYEQRPDWFDTDDSPTHGPGREDTHWSNTLMRESSWTIREEGEESFSCELRSTALFRAQFWGLVNGMEIHPIHAQALTIPIIPEAHAKSVRDFEDRYGTKLFCPRGKDYLAYIDGGRLRVAYLLRTSAYVPPMEERTGRQPFPWATASFRKLLQELFYRAFIGHLESTFKIRVGNQNVSF